MKIHIVIVSEQMLANLIPALMERPDKVYMVCSEEMTKRGLDQRLFRLLAQEAISAEICHGAPDTGMKNIQEFALQLAGNIEENHQGEEIILNATGGNKLMSLGFVDVFRDVASRIIYTDTRHGYIEILPDVKGIANDPIPMTDVLNVRSYLAAQGFRFERALSDNPDFCEKATLRKAACKHLGKNAAQIQDFIGALNRLANKALDRDGNLVEPHQDFSQTPRGNWAVSLKILSNAELLKWQEGTCEILFIDEERTRFLNGGWLEEYAWHIVKDEHVFDTKLSVEGCWDKTQKSDNEFDVLACHRNQLLFIECKTLRHHDESDSELAYKAESLSKAARGLFGETWLLSAREPSPTLHERAKRARIRVLGPNQLPNLRSYVQSWKNGSL